MTDQIYADTEAKPGLFWWNGPVDPSALAQWIVNHGWRVPQDLCELWQRTGGGDIFESETIFWPLSDDPNESLDQAYIWSRSRGFPPDYLVFHERVFTSALRMSDGRYVEINPNTYEEISVYDSLNDWYLNLLRPAFAEKYNLPPVGEEC